MPKYRVLLRGENFLIRSESEPQRLGFYCTRRVREDDEQGAEYAAVALIKNDQSLHAISIRTDDPAPMIYAEEISRLGWWRRLGGRGYTFFPMHEEEDDDT